MVKAGFIWNENWALIPHSSEYDIFRVHFLSVTTWTQGEIFHVSRWTSIDIEFNTHLTVL